MALSEYFYVCSKFVNHKILYDIEDGRIQINCFFDNCDCNIFFYDQIVLVEFQKFHNIHDKQRLCIFFISEKYRKFR